MKKINNKNRDALFTIVFVGFLLNSPFDYQVLNHTYVNAYDQSKPKAIVTFKIIPLSDNTWGYDIYLNNNKTIHQPTIPGLPGNKGFSTKKQAASVAKLVVHKIKEGQMPPSVTIAELKTLKAI